MSNFKFYNPHPQNKLVNDCAKRAITAATGRDYKEVSLELNRYKKITGHDHYSNRDHLKQFITEELHGELLSFPAVAGEPRMNGNRFTEAYPKGKYILSMAKHLVACIDGVIMDTWDCREKCVYQAWRIK